MNLSPILINQGWYCSISSKKTYSNNNKQQKELLSPKTQSAVASRRSLQVETRLSLQSAQIGPPVGFGGSVAKVTRPSWTVTGRQCQPVEGAPRLGGPRRVSRGAARRGQQAGSSGVKPADTRTARVCVCVRVPFAECLPPQGRSENNAA